MIIISYFSSLKYILLTLALKLMIIIEFSSLNWLWEMGSRDFLHKRLVIKRYYFSYVQSNWLHQRRFLKVGNWNDWQMSRTGSAFSYKQWRHHWLQSNCQRIEFVTYFPAFLIRLNHFSFDYYWCFLWIPNKSVIPC